MERGYLPQAYRPGQKEGRKKEFYRGRERIYSEEL
jgi:hypothetical protein